MKMSMTKLIQYVRDIAKANDLSYLHDAADILTEAHYAGYIKDNGIVRKFRGTLPMTADGEIVGENAGGLWVWTDSDGLQQDGTGRFRLEDYDAWTVGDAYSSEDAAKAARAKKKGGKR